MSEKRVPVKGALNQKGNNEMTQADILALVLKRLEGFEKRQEMIVRHIDNTAHASAEQFTQLQKEFHAELQKERQTAQAGLEALKEQFQKVVEMRPDDPKTRREMEKEMIREAQQSLAKDKARFQKELQEMTTGELVNNEGAIVRMIINGVPRDIKPGLNKDVPAIYIEEWEKRVKMKEWAARMDRAYQNEGGQELSMNQVNSLRGGQPMWSDDHGFLS